MIKINEVIIVEGNYDKSKLSGIVDALIVVTDGFAIFKDKKKCDMLRRLADVHGAVIFTDSDSSGFKIRNYLKNILRGKNVKHAYIPDIKGKEKRKNHHSKEGFLGVEGVSDDVIINALKTAVNDELCVQESNPKSSERKITKADLYSDGLCGGSNSAMLREKLKRAVNLPTHLSANMLVSVLNSMYSYDEYKELLSGLSDKK